MMKVTLFAIVVALAAISVNSFGLCPRWSKLIDYKLWKDNVAKLGLSTNECVFFRGTGHDGKVVCYDKTKSDFLECSAHFMFDGLDEFKFDSFALGLNLNQSVSAERGDENPLSAWANTTSVDLFELYPRLHFGGLYMDSFVGLHGKTVRLSLFHSHDITSLGVHILDASCFASLVKFFSELKWFESVELCTFAQEKTCVTKFASFYVI